MPEFTNDTATVALDWEKVRVSFKIALATEKQVAASIKALEEGSSYVSLARYELEQKKDYDLGLTYVNKALGMSEGWLAFWTKEQLLAAKGNKKDALPLAQKAADLGAQNPERFFFEKDVKEEAEAYFLSLPHGGAQALAPKLPKSAKIIDLSGDFRLDDRAAWEKAYKLPHAAWDLKADFAYGIPEINRTRIRESRAVEVAK